MMNAKTMMTMALALALGGFSGCSKKTEETVNKETQPVTIEQPKENASKKAVPAASVAEQPKLPEELQSFAERSAAGLETNSEMPIRLSALMDMGGTPLAGLVDAVGGGEAMVQQGNVFRGYNVKAIDLKAKTVTLEKQGKEYVLKQTGDPSAAMKQPPISPLAGNTNIPGVFKNPDLRNIPMEQFEPTQDEMARGINPNDSSTWPKGYKGPAIERFMAKMTPEERAAAERPSITPDMMKGAKLDPTADEAARGIDPNDHTTWPDGYKGPAIEDYLAEHPEEAAKMAEAEANPPVAPKLEGYEATPEERALGIDPNEPKTWPATYRGPEIEFRLKEQEAKQKAAAQ